MQPVKPESVTVPAVAPVGEVLPPVKVDREALRAICAGNIAPVSVQSEPVEPCRHVEYVEVEGESYRCSLPAGHKGDCARGERIA